MPQLTIAPVVATNFLRGHGHHRDDLPLRFAHSRPVPGCRHCRFVPAGHPGDAVRVVLQLVPRRQMAATTHRPHSYHHHLAQVLPSFRFDLGQIRRPFRGPPRGFRAQPGHQGLVGRGQHGHGCDDRVLRPELFRVAPLCDFEAVVARGARRVRLLLQSGDVSYRHAYGCYKEHGAYRALDIGSGRCHLHWRRPRYHSHHLFSPTFAQRRPTRNNWPHQRSVAADVPNRRPVRVVRLTLPHSLAIQDPHRHTPYRAHHRRIQHADEQTLRHFDDVDAQRAQDHSCTKHAPWLLGERDFWRALARQWVDRAWHGAHAEPQPARGYGAGQDPGVDAERDDAARRYGGYLRPCYSQSGGHEA